MLSGEGLAVPEVGAEVSVEEIHAVFAGGTLCHLPHQLVVLVGADEQGRGEGVEAALGGLPGSLEEAHLVALDAAAGNIGGHLPDEGPQAVVVPLDEGQFDGLGVVPDAVAAGTVLSEGMDVGIVPESRHLQAVAPENLDGLIGTGSTTNVQQGFHVKNLQIIS